MQHYERALRDIMYIISKSGKEGAFAAYDIAKEALQTKKSPKKSS